PHAVAVAKAGEGALVPVLDRAHPGVAERLSIGRGQRGVDGDAERPRRRLPFEAGILEREGLGFVWLVVLAWPGRRGLRDRRQLSGRRHFRCPDRRRVGARLDWHAEADVIADVGRAGPRAAEAI